LSTAPGTSRTSGHERHCQERGNDPDQRWAGKVIHLALRIQFLP